jgi:hypothetical protein
VTQESVRRNALKVSSRPLAMQVTTRVPRKEPPPVLAKRSGGGLFDPAMTDFRACGTIIGLAGLTAVFGMGTGVAPPVWSPEGGRGGCFTSPGRGIGAVVWKQAWFSWWACGASFLRVHTRLTKRGCVTRLGTEHCHDRSRLSLPGRQSAADRGGQAIGC